MIKETTEKVPLIRDRLKTAFSRQKSYADPKRKDVQFAVGDHVFLKVSPMKGVMRFGKKGKLSPRYVGSFEILNRVGSVSYRLALPPSFSHVHPVFHISMLRNTSQTHLISFSLRLLSWTRVQSIRNIPQPLWTGRSGSSGTSRSHGQGPMK